MDTAAEILLIIVSATLTIFLAVAIVATIKLVQILNHLRSLTEKAEKIADSAESVGVFFQKTAGPAAIAKLVANIVHSLVKSHVRSRSMKDRTKKFAIGTIFAAMAGFVTGILTAPKSGKETRKDIKETALKVKNEAEEKLKQLHKELDELLVSAKMNTEQMRGTIKEQATNTLQNALATKEKVQNMLVNAKGGAVKDKELKKAIKEANEAIAHLKKYFSQYAKKNKETGKD